jgi:hypothetical protein
MESLLIIGAFIMLGISSYYQGRRVGAQSMAVTIARVAERKYPDFKKIVARGMLEDLNKARKSAGKEPLRIKDMK